MNYLLSSLKAFQFLESSERDQLVKQLIKIEKLGLQFCKKRGLKVSHLHTSPSIDYSQSIVYSIDSILKRIKSQERRSKSASQFNSCVFFPPNSCVADWQFFTKVLWTRNWYTVSWNQKLGRLLQIPKGSPIRPKMVITGSLSVKLLVQNFISGNFYWYSGHTRSSQRKTALLKKLPISDATVNISFWDFFSAFNNRL